MHAATSNDAPGMQQRHQPLESARPGCQVIKGRILPQGFAAATVMLPHMWTAAALVIQRPACQERLASTC